LTISSANTRKGNPYISLLRVAWRYARGERRRYVLIYAMFGCANLAFAGYPILYGWFVDAIQTSRVGLLRHAWIYGAAYVGLKLLEWCFHGPARIMERQLAFNLSRNFLQERYHQALHLPVKWHQDHHSGATINRIRKAYEALREFFQSGFIYLHALSKFIFSFAAMVYFSPVFGAMGVALGLLTVWVIFRFDGPLIKTQEEVNEREHTISATLFDSLSNIMTVITLRLEKSMESSLMARAGECWPAFRANTMINEWKWFVSDMLVGLTYSVITIGYVYQNWTAAAFPVGGLVTLLGYVNQFTSVFHDMAWQYNQVVQFNTDVQTARDIGDAYAARHRADAAAPLPAGWRIITIEGLNFSHRDTYDGGHAPQSLHDVRIQLQRGRRVALVGESGCGKSTLLALLRGLYAPEPGFSLRFDNGQPISDLGALNQTTTLLPQEPEIFENTIRYNITLGLPIPEEEVNTATASAHFTSVLEQLPKRLESSIQEKGVNLSGGQKQRLALARGLLAARDSDVVLLDEPTSSVDPRTEALIYEHMFAAFRDKAMVSALHRLHLLRHFDYVYVLRDGRIVDEGTFPHLLANSAAFGELWRHQESETPAAAATKDR
jgi:ABC-type multidrug transport system fused ATPase/permease subunit